MRTLKATNGERLFKAVHLRIFLPENKRSVTRMHRAPSGQGINAKGVDMILADTAATIEKSWPTDDYSVVALGPYSFNFVWRGKKSAEA